MLKKTIVGLFLIASIAIAGKITVQPGDTLGALAARYNVSVTELMRLNRLTTQNIRVGQELQLPSSASVTVQSGDTLEAIAKRNNISVDDLRRVNNLRSDAIRPGQSLRLPSGNASSTSSQEKINSPKAATATTYTVRSGDTLEAIGKRLGFSVDALKAANGLKDDRLRLGQVLKLPVASTTAKKPSGSSESAPAKLSADRWVTVQPGDTLSSIAKRNNLSLEALRSLNNLTSDAIRDGQRLRVTAAKPSSRTATSKPTAKPATVTQKPVAISSAQSGSAKVAPKPSSKPTTTTTTAKPVTTTPKVPAVASKPTPKPSSATAPQKPVAQPVTAKPSVTVVTAKPTAPKPVVTEPVANLEPMDASAAAPTPTAPSDILEGEFTFEIVAPVNPPITINRNEKVLWPVSGVLTSRFGYRWGKLHTGLDIATPSGTSVYAALSGTVQFAGWNRYGYGYLVVIRGVDGRDYYYAHNSRILVKRGQFVRQGYMITKSGNTGFSTGPHLHFEIRIGGKPRNPSAYLPRSQVQQARYAGR
jgi:murein DD-endopeptidase MepM/ murein hydrolase activator NlpD